MTAALEVTPLSRASLPHEHVWQLNVEYDAGIGIRERICSVCSAVLSEG